MRHRKPKGPPHSWTRIINSGPVMNAQWEWGPHTRYRWLAAEGEEDCESEYPAGYWRRRGIYFAERAPK